MDAVDLQQTALGIELGSTRIKAILLDSQQKVMAQGGFNWENEMREGSWTYSYKLIAEGVQSAVASLMHEFEAKHGRPLANVGAIGVSAMMHGYLPLNGEGRPLADFRTWRNTYTNQSADELTDLFGVNIPQRWSISHLLHAMKKSEDHLQDLEHLTTLAGYLTFLLTGKHVLGIGDASGMFPIGNSQRGFDESLVELFEERYSPDFQLRDVFPTVLRAGEPAGVLTESGAQFLDPTGILQAGAVVAAPEGDAGTGMVATNAVKPRTGNVSAGTSTFAMLVLEQPLQHPHREIDIVATPSGHPVAMVHSNNCTSDLNAWMKFFGELLSLTGVEFSDEELFCSLFLESVKGNLDRAGLLMYNFMSGEHLVDVHQGRPMLIRHPESNFTVANFMRALLFSAFASMSRGIQVLRQHEDVPVDIVHAHGGIFTTRGVAQRYLAAAFNTPISVSESASEGGAWGMALLAGYLIWDTDSRELGQFLSESIFASQKLLTVTPDADEVGEYQRYLDDFAQGLVVERGAGELKFGHL